MNQFFGLYCATTTCWMVDSVINNDSMKRNDINLHVSHLSKSNMINKHSRQA